MMKRLVNVLKPGGHCIIATMFGKTYYTVGPKTIPTQSLTEEEHKESLAEAGLVIKKESLLPVEKKQLRVSHYTHLHVALAEKSI